MKFKPGDMLPTTEMKAVSGEAIRLPNPKRLVHLRFRRFVDCPICNTHIAEFKKRAREIEAAGIENGMIPVEAFFFDRSHESSSARCPSAASSTR